MSVGRKWTWRVVGVMLLANLACMAEEPGHRERLVYEKPEGAVDDPALRIKPMRGPNSRLPRDLALAVLCPPHTGLTVQERPSIFWYLNEPVKGVVYKIAVRKEGEAQPLLEKQLDPEKDTGIQRLNLKEGSWKLAANTEYSVSVTISPDERQHADDLVITGRIKRIVPPDKLVSQLLTRPTPAERAVVYARQRIWYDALAAISDQIAADPANKALRAERADLLMQVGLPDAADYDRKSAGE